MMLQRVTTAGYVHCLDLTPLGCQTFVMLPASVRFPQTRNVSNVALVLKNPGLGQPPITLSFSAMNVGGNATYGTWTFSKIAGSRRTEPETGGLVALGLLGLAVAAQALKTPRRSSKAQD